MKTFLGLMLGFSMMEHGSGPLQIEWSQPCGVEQAANAACVPLILASGHDLKSERDADLEQAVAELLVWIGVNSDYDVTNVPMPQIVEMSPRDLTKEAYRDMPQFAPESGVDERIWALYNFEDSGRGQIFVRAEGPPETGAAPDGSAQIDPIFLEHILHELVHHVQFHVGAYNRFPCRQHGERDAYYLGGKFLAQRRIMDPLPNRNFWAQIHSRC